MSSMVGMKALTNIETVARREPPIPTARHPNLFTRPAATGPVTHNPTRSQVQLARAISTATQQAQQTCHLILAPSVWILMLMPLLFKHGIKTPRPLSVDSALTPATISKFYASDCIHIKKLTTLQSINASRSLPVTHSAIDHV